MMKGFPVGAAMETFGQRYADLGLGLGRELQQSWTEESVSRKKILALWSAQNDARSWVLLGDPAVRLVVDHG